MHHLGILAQDGAFHQNLTPSHPFYHLSHRVKFGEQSFQFSPGDTQVSRGAISESVATQFTGYISESLLSAASLKINGAVVGLCVLMLHACLSRLRSSF